MTRPIPESAVRFVSEHEGCKLTAYQDQVGVWTIGYGSITSVRPGMVITREQALIRLRVDMQIAVKKLYSVCKPEAIDRLTEHQYAALLSFTFNLGAKASWTIWRYVNAGKLDLVPAEMMKFTKAGGLVRKGLVNRRADEVRLWATVEPGEAPEAHEAPPSAVTRQPGVTPPVQDVKPLVKQNTFVAQTLTGVTIAGAAASQYSAPIKSAADQLAAFTGAPIIEHITTILITIAGLCALAGIASTVLKHRAERQ